MIENVIGDVVYVPVSEPMVKPGVVSVVRGEG